MAHHPLVRFFIERSREVEVELARRKDAVVLGSRPPFSGQFACVGALEPNVKRSQSLPAVDDGEEVTMPLGIEARIVFFEALAIPFQEFGQSGNSS